MIIVMGTARLGPGELDRLGDAMRTQLEATRAEAGCLHYSFARDVLDPDILHVAERWRDQGGARCTFQDAAHGRVQCGARYRQGAEPERQGL